MLSGVRAHGLGDVLRAVSLVVAVAFHQLFSSEMSMRHYAVGHVAVCKSTDISSANVWNLSGNSIAKAGLAHIRCKFCFESVRTWERLDDVSFLTKQIRAKSFSTLNGDARVWLG